MKKNDKEELNRLMAGWMDWNILSLKSADEVNGSSQLSSFEKTYCLSLFDLGEKEVWIAIDLWPSEHSK
ncbi:hypothetical protein HYW73_03230 [Candidatus Nomurabacteria bacterium]|nr:hypothetical protein [Candidatus Nomurabacteria bacterium]